MKHTPGPWATNEKAAQPQIYSESDPTGQTLALVYDHGETRANARLIAAAPELLEVLTAIFFKWQCNESGNALVENYNKARAVIEKATGG